MRLLLAFLVLGAATLGGSAADAQAPPTAQQCSAVLTKDYYSYAMKNNLQTDYLRTIDSDTYAEAGKTGSTSGSAYGGAFTGNTSYDDFNKSRDKYLESLHYSRSEQEALDIIQITTSDRAYSAYEQCLRSVAAGPAVLVWASKETMNVIDLHVKYVNAPGQNSIELYGTLTGGSVKDEPDGEIWSKTVLHDNNKWGVNQERSFTINRLSGVAETTINVRASDGSAPIGLTFKRADALLTLSFVGTIDVSRGQRSSPVTFTPDNNENRGGCPNQVGRTETGVCISKTTVQLGTSAPRFFQSPSFGCTDPNNCGWATVFPPTVSADGLTATSTVNNWGSPRAVVLKADEYEHLSKAQCGEDQQIPVILGHPVLFSLAKECEPIAQIIWKTLAGTQSQGSVPFSWKSSSGGEVVIVGDVTESGSAVLASYKLNKLQK